MGRKWKISIGLIALVIIIPFVYILYDRSLMPPPPPPSPLDPNINITWVYYAHDFLSKDSIPNAFQHYLSAYESVTIVDNLPANGEMQYILQNGWTQEYPNAAQTLELNKKSIQEILIGTKLPRCEFPPPANGLKISYTHYNYLNKLLICSGKRLEREKKTREALDYYLAAIQFSRDLLKRNQSIVTRMMSDAITQYASKPLLQLLSNNQLQPKDLKYLIQILEKLSREQVPLQENVRISRDREYLQSYTHYQHPFQNAKYFVFTMDLPATFQEQCEMKIWGIYLFFNKGRILRNTLLIQSEMLEKSKTLTLKEYAQYDWKSRVPHDWVNQSYIEFYKSDMWIKRGILVINDLRQAMIQSAIQLYLIEKKKQPDKLEDLKEYLSDIPTDPFSDKQYQWGKDSSGLFVYSVGPDFKDDKGVLFYDPSNGTLSAGDIKL